MLDRRAQIQEHIAVCRARRLARAAIRRGDRVSQIINGEDANYRCFHHVGDDVCGKPVRVKNGKRLTVCHQHSDHNEASR